MAFHASVPAIELESGIGDLTPRQTVAELDKYVIGQNDAKRAVAVALRNRLRRQKVSPEMAEEIAPKNILMIGPTGVGKTEIARRLARLTGSPFLKVEATKYTEVGYVGRDVESMVRDLTEIAVEMVREERAHEIEDKAETNAEERVLDLLLPPVPPPRPVGRGADPEAVAGEHFQKTREKLREQLRDGKLDGRTIELDVREKPMPFSLQVFDGSNMLEGIDFNLPEMIANMMGNKTKKRKMRINEALEYLIQEEEQKLIDMELVARQAGDRVEQSGIIFIDEIDKIAGRESGHGPDISREGVQRDLLPIIEGTTVNTRYGMIRTDHILFIAAGAFHVTKPSDLIPELQGRFPIRVELTTLTAEDFRRILTEPKNALVKQYTALLETEGIKLKFTEDAIVELSKFATMVNDAHENIGARRLHTIMEALLEDISFDAPEMKKKTIKIDAEYVRKTIGDIVGDEDLARYIL